MGWYLDLVWDHFTTTIFFQGAVNSICKNLATKKSISGIRLLFGQKKYMQTKHRRQTIKLLNLV
jgi:hypothetical protein